MAFKLVERQYTPKFPADRVGITTYGFCFGDDAKATIGTKEYMEVYVDEENSRLGFKPTDKTLAAYKILASGKHPAVNGTKVSKLFEKGRYSFFVEDGMIVVSAPKKQ